MVLVEEAKGVDVPFLFEERVRAREKRTTKELMEHFLQGRNRRSFNNDLNL